MEPKLSNIDVSIKHVLQSTGRFFQKAAGLLRARRNETNMFMELPPELHLMIFRHVLLSPLAIDLWPKLPDKGNAKRYHAQSHRATAARRATQCLHPELLRVSRAIHAEASAVLYGENEFRFTDLDGWIALSGFLATIKSRHSRLLRHITVHIPLPGIMYQCPKHIFTAEYEDELDQVCKRIQRSGLRGPPTRSNAAAFEDCCVTFAEVARLKTLNFIVPANYDARDEWKWYATAFHLGGPPNGFTGRVRERLGSKECRDAGITRYDDKYIRRYGVRRVLQMLQEAIPNLQISLVELESTDPSNTTTHSAQCRKGLKCKRRHAIHQLACPHWRRSCATVDANGHYDIKMDQDTVGNSLFTGGSWCDDSGSGGNQVGAVRCARVHSRSLSRSYF